MFAVNDLKKRKPSVEDEKRERVAKTNRNACSHIKSKASSFLQNSLVVLAPVFAVVIVVEANCK